MYCNYCGSGNHIIDNCPKTWGGQTNRASMHCTYCGSQHHNLPACPKTFDGNASRAWNEDSIVKDFVKDWWE
ncbi:MAG: hypothetical protein M3367_03100 [Acidobacteriota bacterium]|nr:hypothetical protein [Acidobacteriota bacterium]